MGKSLTGDRLKHITIKGKRLNELPQLPILDTMELQGDLKDLPKANYEKLVKTHLKHGIFLPFYVWESPEGINYIADGHQRRRVLPNEGYTGNVPVVYIEAANRQEAKEKLLVISSQYGRITQEGFDEFTFDLPDIGDIVHFDALSFEFGQDEDEEPEQGDAEPQTDRAAELQELWQTERGQLWAIGEHRLLCGDSTVRADVERVMGGDRAEFCFTDPPYNVGVSYTRETDDNKSKASFIEWCKLWAGFLPSKFCLTVGVKRLLWWDDITGDPQWIIEWIKRNGQSNTGLGGTNKHDPILVYGVDRDGDIDIVEVNNDYSEKLVSGGDHPTPKPIELWSKIIVRFSETDDIIFEPFCGTGTTLLACQNLSRRGRAIEISPAYCAVILQRMADAFPGIDIYKVD